MTVHRNPMPAAAGCRSFCLGEQCPLRALGWPAATSTPPTPPARPVRRLPRVTDGPFAETKEMVGAPARLPAARPTRETHAPAEAETLV